MEFLNIEDMTMLVEKTVISMGNSPAEMDSMFEAWGMEPDSIKEVVIQAVQATSKVSRFTTPEQFANAMVDTTILGFVLGCMATLEVETRKQTNENGE